ncbi:PIN domain-containing protein [Pyrodictium abyssi]|uniref:PIN domain-containing protein n=1 Tax=Pyrodictium abyssi TaxID=54256 RepID=A0ABN6ZUB1_9CREN|nr:hypothetical protein PABY_13830 [Pyrodictium abyssi]
MVAEKLLEEEAAVLDLTLYEAANAAVIEARRGLVQEPHRLAAAVSRLAGHLAVLRIKPEDLEAISKLAEQLGLTAYDAAYVYYARLHGAKLLTSDKEILAKARDIAVGTSAWLQGARADTE